MNSRPMSNIDKHAVQAVADLKAGYTLGHADVAILNELARIALASLEAEHVGYMNRFTGRVFTLEEQPGADTDSQVYVPLYTAPPAPVSVPDAIHSQGEKSASDDYYALGWNACRAAMLQGAENAESPSIIQPAPELDYSPKNAESPAGINQGKSEPVTTAYKLPFEQWLSQQTGTIDVECGCVMTEVFFHWLRVAYEAGNSPVIPDGWVLVPIEPTMSQEFAGYRTLTDTGKMSRLMKTRLSNIYRAMIATAPQQEVK